MKKLDSFIERYRNEGLSFIPIPYKSKVPAIEWKQFQQMKPNDGQVKSWFNGRDTNLAVICGSVSGGLVVLDFDIESGHTGWRQHRHLLLGDVPEIVQQR